MMSLQDLIIKDVYRSKLDDLVHDFYIPVLSQSIIYKRSVAFFSSTSLIEISKGICNFVKRGGKIYLVTSPCLSEEDIEAIKIGYRNRNDIIKDALIRELHEPKSNFESERLNLLANLIAYKILEIKIAVVENGLGIYHEKLGLIEDEFDNVVAFTGSMNESKTAMRDNYEAVDVFCSWDEKDVDRVNVKKQAFEAIWGNYEIGIDVLSFPAVSEEIINRYRKDYNIDYLIDDTEFKKIILEDKSPRKIGVPDNIQLRPYQQEAIANWVKNDYRGIFDMATGTGKTFTGLAAISKLWEDINNKLAVIIICPYQHLVEQWVEDIIRFNMKPIIGYSSSPQKDWKQLLSKAVRDQKLRADKGFFCFICTNATFTNNHVQEQINKINYPILLVVDEAHNFGAPTYARLLDDRFAYRLALSATLERHRDEEGTAILYEFFGKKCIEYSLERAIREEKLTPYKYYPIVVHLNDDELFSYEQLSYEMAKCIIKGKNGKYKLNKYGEILALKRARIVAGASEKLVALREKIQPYIHDNNILVYCGATNVLDENADSSFSDEADIRQIEAVTRILGNELEMDVAQFTASENMEARTSIKEQFQRGDRLQAIIAIKCLDEGVNIPGIRTAFILASSTNPKEYIQRRGRVLRKAPNKPYAVIYDFVTLPRPLDSVSSLTAEQAQRDLTLVRNELARIKEFGRLSQNSMEANNLIWDIQDTYNINDTASDGGGFDNGAD